MSLHYGGLTITIDDQSREIIAFSVNETVGIVLWIVCNLSKTFGELFVRDVFP